MEKETQKSLWQAKLGQAKSLDDVLTVLREWWPTGAELNLSSYERLSLWLLSLEEHYGLGIRAMEALIASVSMVMENPTPSMSDLRRALMTGFPHSLSDGDKDVQAAICASFLVNVLGLHVMVKYSNIKGRARFVIQPKTGE